MNQEPNLNAEALCAEIDATIKLCPNITPEARKLLEMAKDELRGKRRKCGTPEWMVEALNSGDGTYKP